MERTYDIDLEDYDSKVGDLEKGSLAATQSSTSTRELSEHDEGVRRGVMNANADHNQSAKSPNSFLEMLQNGGYSVTTKRIDEIEDPYDTFTFDGSTITSANDITHKKFSQPNSPVVEFPGQDGQGGQQYPPIKPSATESTASSWGGKVSEKSRVKKFCCGLGRMTVILLSIAVTVVAVAFILWLVLGYLPRQGSGSGRSACCLGRFEPDWSGREICSADHVCCVVCASSIVQEDANNLVVGIEGEDPEDPPTPPPTVKETEETTVPHPCCEDYRWGDYEGRLRCAETCCQVCLSTLAAPTSPTATEPKDTLAPSAMGTEASEPVTTPLPTPQEESPAPTLRETSIPTASPSEAAQETMAPSAAAQGTMEPPSTNSSSSTAPPTELGLPVAEGVSETSLPLPCCEDYRWGDYQGRLRCVNTDEGEETCCQVCL